MKKDFKAAKVDFVDAMLSFAAPASPPRRILDVGCGIGGTSRILAAKFPGAQVQGITLSPVQVVRATQLAADAGLDNVAFRVMDALALEFEEGSFDLVWVSGGKGRVLGVEEGASCGGACSSTAAAARQRCATCSARAPLQCTPTHRDQVPHALWIHLLLV